MLGGQSHRGAPQIALVQAPSPAGCPGRDGAGLMAAACARSSSPSRGEMSLAKGRAGGAGGGRAHRLSPLPQRGRGMENRLAGGRARPAPPRRGRLKKRSTQGSAKLPGGRGFDLTVPPVPRQRGQRGQQGLSSPPRGAPAALRRAGSGAGAPLLIAAGNITKGARVPASPSPPCSRTGFVGGFLWAEAPLESLPEPVPLPVTPCAQGFGVAAPLGGSAARGRAWLRLQPRYQGPADAKPHSGLLSAKP